jgi:hypothetical protein
LTSVTVKYPCPKCGKELTEIRYPSDCMLNRDQWESHLAGNLYCTCHNNNRGNKPYAYFWKHEFENQTASPVPPSPVSDKAQLDTPWRCFHCDFVTSDADEAQAHFGDRDDADEFKPFCKWMDRISADERIGILQDTLKQLETERRDNNRLRAANEGREYKANSIEPEIKSFKPFRGCRTIYDVFCLYDSMKAEPSRQKHDLQNRQ